MSFFRCLAILTFVVKSSDFLDTPSINFDVRTFQEDITFVSSNCSSYEPDPTFELYQFDGSWNYLKFYSGTPISSNLNCMRLESKINYRKVYMDISMPKFYGESSTRNDYSTCRNVSIMGVTEMTKERREVAGLWTLYNDISLAPSKWIVLSGNSHEVLYMICGDYPDHSSTVGEIGILSRDTRLSQHLTLHFQQTLANYALHVVLGDISQNECE